MGSPALAMGESITVYKPFVDGLRAVAVISVVFYHVGIPWMSGGFVGVDVFFVISGFLIINQIIEAIQKGKFSFADFWSRRALRILPPYLLVILACMVIAPFVLVEPLEYSEFSKEIGWSAIFAVNHLFLSQQGYFDLNAALKVLLHLWSLAVEEQFYLIAPLLLYVLWKIPSKVITIIGWVAFAASLAACIIWTTPGGQNWAFYVMPFRAWEFIAGGSVAFLVPYAAKLPRFAIEFLGLLGLAFIACAVVYFSPAMAFPSYLAVLPVFGSMAVILSGIVDRRIGTARLLAFPPMVWVGLVPYAWYLWHWPLLALIRIHEFGHWDQQRDVSVAIIALALAIATRFGIEKPIQKWRRRHGRMSFKPAMVGVLACVLIGFGGRFGFQRHAHTVAASIPPQMERTQTESLGVCDLGPAPSLQPCLDAARGEPIGVLIGDSHAGSSTRVINAAATANGTKLAGLIYGGCPPLLGVRILNPDVAMNAACERYRANALKYLPQLHPTYVVMVGMWELYGRGKPDYALADPGSSVATIDQDSLYIAAVKRTISTFKKAGAKRFLILAPTPSFPLFTPDCVLRSDYYGISRERFCSTPRDKVNKERATAMRRLTEATSGMQNVRIIDPIDIFCDAKSCRSYTKDAVLFNDTNHPTDTAVTLIYKRFKGEFRWVFTGK
jgi:peptidoglycan/LPS O-acetylase OafA/YrhL